MTDKKSPQLLLKFLVLGLTPFFINNWLNEYLVDNPVIFWILDVFAWVILPASIAFILIRKHGMSFRDVGLGNPFTGMKESLRLINVAVIATVVLFFSHRVAFTGLSVFFPDQPTFSYQTMIPGDGNTRYLVICYFAITAGIVEEFYYRGLLLRVVRCFDAKDSLYLLVSPILFALAHWEQGLAGVGASWVFGVLACIVYLRLRNLRPLITSHIVIDLILFS